MKSFDTGRQDGQNIKFSPTEPGLLACVSGEHFGVTGNNFPILKCLMIMLGVEGMSDGLFLTPIHLVYLHV
jgi:hypothetical protein